MDLTESDAAELVRVILNHLRAFDAVDVIAGIDESRRLGIDETFRDGASALSPSIAKADIREVGKTLRRPPTNREMLSLVLDRLHQRLIVVPSIAHSLEQKLGPEIVWRVEPEFVLEERIQTLQAKLRDLLPDQLDKIPDAYDKLSELIGEAAPARESNG